MANTCSSFTTLESSYNLALHVGAIFLILIVSGSACAFPLIVVKIPQLRVPSTFLFFVRHFGTGVLLATAFVHLLPTAFTSLTDPCLPDFWNQTYPAMAGAIAMAAVFVIVVIEMVFSPGRSMCAAPEIVGDGVVDLDLQSKQDCGCVKDSKGEDEDEIVVLPTAETEMDGEKGTISQSTTDTTSAHHVAATTTSQSSRPPSLSPTQQFKRETLQCVLLEMGILFHSVFIGMALSVATGNDFVVLLIAISFHQTFEGLALGSRIASVKFPSGSHQPWLMALAYGCTTPIGQAIGLAMHSAYDPASATGLIVVGVMNAVSSGLLTYASLVELMAEDFLSERSWSTLRGRRRVTACVLVFAGAVAMALVGAWA